MYSRAALLRASRSRSSRGVGSGRALPAMRSRDSLEAREKSSIAKSVKLAATSRLSTIARVRRRRSITALRYGADERA